MACFVQLRDSVPSWITDANQLAVHVYTKRVEFGAERKNRRDQDNVSRRSPANSLSTYSRSQRSSSVVAPRSARHGLKRILSMDSLKDTAKRRRVDEEKPLVMYDGHTQKALEQMVRNIWSAKSSIRSSRITSSMRKALRGRTRMPTYPRPQRSEKTDAFEPGLSTIEVDDNNDAITPDDDASKDGHEISVPEFRVMRKPTRPKESPYDFIESQLDAAQNLCETAAYRFLREGNCLDELEGLVQVYELVLEAATTMAEQQQEEEEEEEEKEYEQTENTDNTPACEGKVPGGGGVGVLMDGADSPDELNAAILEVDERSETSEVSIDITAFRMTRYGQRTLHPFTLTRRAR